MATEGDENEDEDKVLGSNTQWNDSGVDTLIALHEEIEPEFVKNGKKTRYLYILPCKMSNSNWGPFQGLGLCLLP